MPTIEEVLVPAPEPSSADWNDEGVVILRSLMSETTLDAYERCC